MENDKLLLGSDDMIYPTFIKKGDMVGVSAPSYGVTREVKVRALNMAISKLNEKGYQILETPHVRRNEDYASGDAKMRAQELESLYQNQDVKAIICATGGEFLLEMLSYFDFSVVKDNIKWLQGYSDPTGLLFTITTNYDIATIYGHNFVGFGMNPWHESIENNLKILEGNLVLQKSFPMYEGEEVEQVLGTEEYVLNTPVCWKNLNSENDIKIEGRMIGGCIDIITELFGTRFDKTKEFIEKYKNEGIVWYFDNCELSSEDLVRTLWKFKDNGWFHHCNGIIFGRSACHESNYGISFEEAIGRVLGELNIPIITGADFGHVPPRMTIINGGYAIITSKDGKGTISFRLK